MGYLHIENLYRPIAQTILLFKEVYAMEKVHGTSCNISRKRGDAGLTHFPGGESIDNFRNIFKGNDILFPRLIELEEQYSEIKIYGEGYGGKCQKQSERYGNRFSFIVFDIQLDNRWLSVEKADMFATGLGLEFVPYVKISTDLKELDKERDAPSEVAKRRGCGIQQREGIVLRPLLEFTNEFGERVIAKHKGEGFAEVKKIIKVGETPEVLTEANAIADNWCTETRLDHVLDKIPGAGMADILKVINAMLEDILREGQGEIVVTDNVKKAIRNKTVTMFKKKVQEIQR